jgi:hypothetical protein
MGVRYWHHPAEMITFRAENNEETSTVQIFTAEASQTRG